MNELLPLLSAGGGLGGVVVLVGVLLRWVSTDRKDAQVALAARDKSLAEANNRERSAQQEITELRRQMRESEDRLIREKRALEQENFTLRLQVGAAGGINP